MRFCVMLTCFNRKSKTINCIKSLISANSSDIHFIVVDDGSTDGTADALEAMAKEAYEKDGRVVIDVFREKGGLFYSGGMGKAMRIARDDRSSDYFVLANDDVEFDKGILDDIARSINVGTTDPDTVLVGAMRDKAGKCSYGGVKYYSGIHYKQVGPDAADRECDTFNANFVAVPRKVFLHNPIIDPVYVHSLGDFDYGLQLKKKGYRIEVTDHFVGICTNNPKSGTWMDRSLSRVERIRRKETPKGAPFKQWFHFLNKNFGLGYALVYSITPYIRIVMGK